MPLIASHLRRWVEAHLIEHGIAFIVIGGTAVKFHHPARLTSDLDLFVSPDEPTIDRLVEATRASQSDPKAKAKLLSPKVGHLAVGLEPHIDLLTYPPGLTFAEGRPLSPVHLRGAFAADGALVLSWVRRGRTEADPWDGLDVPLGEDAERYRVRIEAAGGGAIVLEGDAPRLDVTAAMQVAAFGGLPLLLDVGVAQVGVAHGLGTERRARFERS